MHSTIIILSLLATFISVMCTMFLESKMYELDFYINM